MRLNVRQLRAIGFISFALFAQTGVAQQKPGSLDATFDAGSLYSEVDYLVPDGKVIGLALGPNDEIGGHFTGFGPRFGEKPWNGIARLHQDGTLDETFAVPIFDQSLMNHIDAHDIFVESKGTVWAGFVYFDWRFGPDGSENPFGNESVGVQFVYPDGGVLAFVPDPQNPTVQRFSHFLTDGRLDSNFKSFLDARLLLRSGKVLASELIPFDPSDFVYSEYIERRNEDGSLDSTFQRLKFEDGYGEINILLERPNGQVYAIGEFTKVNSEPWPKLVRFNLDGSIDRDFRPDSRLTQVGTNAPVIQAAALQQNGKLLLGVNFSQGEALLRPGIVRLNSDGSVDPSFDPGEGISEGNDGFPPKTWNMTVQRDGKILIAGDFTKFDGIPRDGIARLFGDPVAPVRIQNMIRLVQAPLRFDVSGTAEVVEIEASDNLMGGWSLVAALNMTNGVATYVESGQQNSSSRFYRARVR